MALPQQSEVQRVDRLDRLAYIADSGDDSHVENNFVPQVKMSILVLWRCCNPHISTVVHKSERSFTQCIVKPIAAKITVVN